MSVWDATRQASRIYIKYIYHYLLPNCFTSVWKAEKELKSLRNSVSFCWIPFSVQRNYNNVIWFLNWKPSLTVSHQHPLLFWQVVPEPVSPPNRMFNHKSVSSASFCLPLLLSAELHRPSLTAYRNYMPDDALRVGFNCTTRYAVQVLGAPLVAVCLVRKARDQTPGRKRKKKKELWEQTDRRPRFPPQTHTHITGALMVMYARKPTRVSDG